MNGVKERAAYYMLFIAVLILVASVSYDAAMKTLEPRPYPPEDVEVSLFHSLQVVVETFTATGYGSDSPWLSPELNLLVILLDLTGVALFFLALPAVLIPLFQDALSRSPPTEIEDGLSDHVVICTYSERAEILVDELSASGIEYVLVEPDGDRALELDEGGYAVIHADPESVADLQSANLADARALVADVSDQIDASIVLAAKEAAEETRVISVVEDPDKETYHRLAGADDILTPRNLLGNGLAGKVTAGLSSDLGDAIEIGDQFDVMEVPIRQGSDLAGTTLADSNIRERFGVNVVGVWYRGEFETPPPPERPLESGTVLLVAASPDQLEALAAATRAAARRLRRGETVVVGHGEVGRTVTEALAAVNLPYTVVDREDDPAVDVVGDAADADTLRTAGVPDARSIVLAIPDDTTTEFATLVVRDLNGTGEVIARADDVGSIGNALRSEATEVGSIRKMYRAGADYVLSLATVSGRSIASEIIESEEFLTVGTKVNVVRTRAPGLAGSTIEEARIRERTGCTVVAIERDGELRTAIDPTFRLQRDDELVVAGTAAGTSRFVEEFC
jgi:Trk K+ transport system NAD-binding subunit